MIKLEENKLVYPYGKADDPGERWRQTCEGAGLVTPGRDLPCEVLIVKEAELPPSLLQFSVQARAVHITQVLCTFRGGQGPPAVARGRDSEWSKL